MPGDGSNGKAKVPEPGGSTGSSCFGVTCRLRQKARTKFHPRPPACGPSVSSPHRPWARRLEGSAWARCREVESRAKPRPPPDRPLARRRQCRSWMRMTRSTPWPSCATCPQGADVPDWPAAWTCAAGPAWPAWPGGAAAGNHVAASPNAASRNLRSSLKRAMMMRMGGDVSAPAGSATIFQLPKGGRWPHHACARV